MFKPQIKFLSVFTSQTFLLSLLAVVPLVTFLVFVGAYTLFQVPHEAQVQRH
jgi:hypothetical protein